jgi:hypothetical protein
MSIRTVSVLVCDGCGTVIDMDFYIRACPGDQKDAQKVVKRRRIDSSERHFCCEACEAWWRGQFPVSGPWGPAWDEREWWCEKVGPCSESIRVRSTHEKMPLLDLEGHLEDPEPL